jgi:nucleotide-binding universal stress UspA family protein
MKIKKILVAVNGSPLDKEAIELACSLARKPKAEIYAIHVIEVKRSLPIDAEVQHDIIRAEEILKKAENAGLESDVKIKTDLIQSRAAGPAIIDEANDRNIDIIILGLSYKQQFGIFSMGNTIPHVMEEAGCRVILLRGSAQS